MKKIKNKASITYNTLEDSMLDVLSGPKIPKTT